MSNFSGEPAPSTNAKSTTIANVNSILYGMDNYVNDVPQQRFHSTEECNIGNNIKIRISIDSKIPVKISQEQEQHGHMPSNSFCKPWQNDSTLTNSLHHGKEPSADNNRMPEDRNQVQTIQNLHRDMENTASPKQVIISSLNWKHRKEERKKTRKKRQPWQLLPNTKWLERTEKVWNKYLTAICIHRKIHKNFDILDPHPAKVNHKGATLFPEQIHRYFETEIEWNAMMAPFPHFVIELPFPRSVRDMKRRDTVGV